MKLRWAVRKKRRFLLGRIMRSSLTCICALLIGFPPAKTLRIDAAITDAQWTGVGQAQGFSAERYGGAYGLWIDALGSVYVCARSSRVGGMIFESDFIKWDGRIWSEWSGSKADSAGQLYNLFTNGNGSLYGAWQQGTSSAVAKWDGNAWRMMDGRFNGTISNLVVAHSGVMYVSGDFNSVGEMSAKNIARWDGGKWHALGNGLSGDVNWEGPVRALVTDDSGNLYAAGTFDTAGTIAAHHIAKWDGSTWNTPGGGVNDTIFALAIDNSGNVYAGGDFDSAGEIAAHHVARWDGSSWHALGNGVSSWYQGSYTVRALACNDSGNLYVGGFFDTAGSIIAHNIAKWDGSAWSSLGFGVNGGVGYIAFDNNGKMFVQGSFSVAGGKPADEIAQWNGSEWSPLGQMDGNGLNYMVNALATDVSGNLYAGGGFSTAGIKSANCMAKWADNSWSALGGGLNGGVCALAVDHSGILYAGGGFDSADSITALHIAKWDGNSWTSLGGGLNGTVYALVVDRNGILYAGGEFDTAGSISAHNIAMWNGSAWSSLESGTNKAIFALAIDSTGKVYAGGDFDYAGSATAHHIARWDGSAWNSLGTGTHGPVYALTIDDNGNVYEGGGWNYGSSITADNIAKWDGNSWTLLGKGLNGKVFALAVDPNGTLYAGGYFDTANSMPVHNIAKWDGKTWSSLGSGIEAYIAFGGKGGVASLCIDKNILYAGGYFSWAGGKASVNFALCTLNNTARTEYSPSEKPIPPLIAFEAGKNLVRVRLKSETIVDIRIYSLGGRLMHCSSEKMFPGEQVFRLPAAIHARGVYLARVKAGSETAQWKSILGR